MLEEMREMFDLNFDKMDGSIMAVVMCDGEVVDAGLMTCDNLDLSMRSNSIIFDPCRLICTYLCARVFVDCDRDALLFDVDLRSMSRDCVNFRKESISGFGKDGLIPAVVYDPRLRSVAMVDVVDLEALELTRDTGKATFFSRTRHKPWVKGEASGNIIEVASVTMNKRADAGLYTSTIPRSVCHTGEMSCFTFDSELTTKFNSG